MIAHLKVHGVKAVKRTVELGRINIFNGGNSAGKTAMMSAVKLALLGFDPDLGKQHQSTRKLMTGNKMSVTATYSDGRIVSHVWTKTGYEVDPANFEPAPVDQFSLKEFWKRTAKDRARLLLSGARCTVDVRDLRASWVAAMIEAGVEFTDAVMAPIDDHLRTLKNPGSIPWLESVSMFVQESLKFAKQRARETSAAVVQLTGVQEGEEVVPEQIPADQTQLLADLTARSKKATADLQAIGTEIAVTKAKIDLIRTTGTGLRTQLAAAKVPKPASQPKCSCCGASVQCTCQAAGPTVNQNEVTRLEQAVVKELEKYNSAKTLLADLEGRLPAAEQLVTGIEDQRAPLMARQAAWHRHQGKIQERAKAETFKLEIQSKVTGYGIIADQMTKLIGETLNEAIRPFLDTANVIIKPVIGCGLRYRDGDFFILRSETEVDIDVMGGSETAVVTAGLQYALTESSGFKVMMVDELGRMTPPTLRAFLKMVEGLVEAGKLNQFFGSIPGTLQTFDDTITVITMKS